MKVDININASDVPKKKEDTLQDDFQPWPTILLEEEMGGQSLEIEFYDGGTRWDDNLEDWVDIEGFTRCDENCLKKVYETTESFRGNTHLHTVHAPTDATVKIYSSVTSETENELNPRVPESVISEEYGIENKDRFKRKPLGPLMAGSQINGNRWMLGGSYYRSDNNGEFLHDFGFFNIRFQLKTAKDAEPYADVNMDLFCDGKNKILKPKRRDYFEGETFDPLTFEGKISGQFYPKVEELSAKSFCHYDLADKYTFDYLEGIHFQPFDLSDNENFKVTRIPSFDADEVPGIFVSGGKWRCFLMPRRWAYYVRYRDHSKTTEIQEFDYSIPDPDDLHEIETQDWTDNYALYTHTVTWTKEGSGEPVQYHHETTIGQSVNYIGLWWGRFPHALVLTLMDIVDPPYEWYELSSKQRIHYGLGQSSEVESEFDLTCSETLDEVKENFQAAGGSEIDAEKLSSGGSNASFHIVAPDNEIYIPVSGQGSDGNQRLGCIRAKGNGQIPDTSYLFGGHHIMTGVRTDGVYSTIGTAQLWDAIEDSYFWQEIIKPMYDVAKASLPWGTDTEHTRASRIQAVPFGIAISPSTAGELVAILVDANDNTYYVWRKTDENFEEDENPILKTVGDPENKHCVRFDAMRMDGAIPDWDCERPFDASWNGWGEGGCNTPWGDNYIGFGTARPRDYTYCDQFSGGNDRKITKFGRGIERWDMSLEELGADPAIYAPGTLLADAGVTAGMTFSKSAEDEGEVELPCPIYLMCTDERYFPDPPMIEGYPFPYDYRFLRQCRNAFAFTDAGGEWDYFIVQNENDARIHNAY